MINHTIAATADLHALRLQTLNSKHYPMLADVKVPYTKNNQGE